MANSTITIGFTEDLAIGAQVNLKWIISPQGVFTGATGYNSTFVALRTGPKQVKVGIPTSNFGERSAINFVQAFNLDVLGFIVTRNINVVTIESNLSPGYDLTFLDAIPSEIGVEINYTNFDPETFIFNTDYFAPALIPCTHVKFIATTNILASKILSPILVNPNTNNPFEFEVLRGTTFELLVESASGTQISSTITTPDVLNGANFEVIINNSPSGATVVLQNNSTIYGLSLEYSLDQITWQESNVFSGIDIGNYNIYVRDNFGCSFNKSFEINEFGIQSPYFYISKSNSFRFANRITWGDSENYKNDENTLSHEVDAKISYQEIQQFQSADVITTQFKSNYETNVAKIIKSDLSEVNIPIVQKTNNIGITDARDARKYNYGNGKTGVYFISGNTYDYTTNVFLDSYSLNGLLPEWAQIGNYFNIDSSWFLIEEIVFDEAKNADVIIYSNTYSGNEINVITKSIFNRFNYEVYEFSIDMVDYIDQQFRVKLVNENENLTTITHLSELIWCKVKHTDLLEIKYSNTTNTDMFYSTGIVNLIRIPYRFIKGKLDEESESYKTDTTTILLNASIYESDDFVFEPNTKEIWKKLCIALSHEIVSINGIGYVKNGSFSTEGPLEESNLYVLTANMIKTGSVYISQSSGGSDFDGTAVEVPGLISTESGFISY